MMLKMKSSGEAMVRGQKLLGKIGNQLVEREMETLRSDSRIKEYFEPAICRIDLTMF